jgi:hypothetical protein
METLYPGDWIVCERGHRKWLCVEIIRSGDTMQSLSVVDVWGEHPISGPVDCFCYCGADILKWSVNGGPVPAGIET